MINTANDILLNHSVKVEKSMIKILFISLAITFVSQLMVGATISDILMIQLVGICGVVMFYITKNIPKLKTCSKYIVCFSFFLLCYALMNVDYCIRTLFIFYILPASVTIFLDKKIIISMNLACCGYVSYLVLTNPELFRETNKIGNLGVYILQFVILLSVSLFITKIVRDMLNTICEKQLAILDEQENTLSILTNVDKSTLELNDITSALQISTEKTDTNSKEILIKTENISSLINTQTISLNKISESVDAANKNLEGNFTTIGSILGALNNTKEHSQSSSEKILAVKSQMNDIQEQINTITNQNKVLEDYNVKIKEHLEKIKKIADETNMLSLNASIEAAHSHEYGKGFAVIASDIKKLSEETAKFTEEIYLLNTEKSILESAFKDALLREIALINASSMALEETVDALLNINSEMGSITSEALNIDALMQNTLDRFEKISLEASTIASSNKINNENIYEILSKNKEQEDVVAELKNNYNELTNIMNNLNSILKR